MDAKQKAWADKHIAAIIDAGCRITDHREADWCIEFTKNGKHFYCMYDDGIDCHQHKIYDGRGYKNIYSPLESDEYHLSELTKILSNE
jgi:hypothetical protein